MVQVIPLWTQRNIAFSNKLDNIQAMFALDEEKSQIRKFFPNVKLRLKLCVAFPLIFYIDNYFALN